MDGSSSAFCDCLQRTCSCDNTWLQLRSFVKESTVGSHDTVSWKGTNYSVTGFPCRRLPS